MVDVFCDERTDAIIATEDAQVVELKSLKSFKDGINASFNNLKAGCTCLYHVSLLHHRSDPQKGMNQEFPQGCVVLLVSSGIF